MWWRWQEVEYLDIFLNNLTIQFTKRNLSEWSDIVTCFSYMIDACLFCIVETVRSKRSKYKFK